MNGDTALLCPNTIKTPTSTSIMIIGVSHQAFLTFRKSQSSAGMDLFFPILTD